MGHLASESTRGADQQQYSAALGELGLSCECAYQPSTRVVTGPHPYRSGEATWELCDQCDKVVTEHRLPPVDLMRRSLDVALEEIARLRAAQADQLSRLARLEAPAAGRARAAGSLARRRLQLLEPN